MIGSYSVDDVLTTGKSEIQASVKELIIEKMNYLDVGIQLVNITIQDAEPPTEEVIEAAKILYRRKIPAIAITSFGENRLVKYTQRVLYLNSSEFIYSKIATCDVRQLPHFSLRIRL